MNHQTYAQKLREELKKTHPELQVDSIMTAPSMVDDGQTVFTFRGKGFAPVMIRSNYLEDALERGGPGGTVKYIAEKIRLASR